MTFRGRLRLFFTIIVIVPMLAVALVLFALTGQSETGKADAGIATGLQVAFRLYRDGSDAAAPTLRRAAEDGPLRAALVDGRTGPAQKRMRELLAGNPAIASIALYSSDGRKLAGAGSPLGIAPQSAPIASPDGRTRGRLAVSVTPADRLAVRVSRLSGLEVSVFAGGRRLASTVRGAEGTPERGTSEDARDFKLGGKDYRGRLSRIDERLGPPTEIAVFREAGSVDDAISNSRLLIGAILLAFLALALASSVFVVRALQGQIGQFLAAAKGLASGKFEQRVPTEGRDEFAELGREFNSMSQQLEQKVEEVESRRQELQDTIRRVGAALATGLDRQGVVRLAVETAVEACEADAGRALPVDREAFGETRKGDFDRPLSEAVEQAERRAFEVSPEVGMELLEPVDPSAPRPTQREAVGASSEDVYALAAPMRARLGSRSSAEYVGVMSIVRRGREFTLSEEELLRYLAGQAVQSIENASLHETVQRQAVTDELTGLANIRQLHATLDRELERSRRFRSPLGLLMVDIDDFKQVNDSYGHQQGDEILAAVASVLRDLSRDIDTPVRYGGEELAVILPETDSEGAAQVGERMRDAIERLRVPRMDGNGHLRVTASFGAAAVPDSASEKEALIASSDAALFTAKRAGKNRVERASAVAAPS
ncbi:MAG: diguanylate cyclase [Thermoleophilaceae bacterium]